MRLIASKYTENDFPYILRLTQNEIGAYFSRRIYDQEVRHKIKINQTYMIYNGTERIGFVSFRPRNDFLYIDSLALDPAMQNKGISGKIFKWLQKKVQENNLNGLTLHVYKTNKQAIRAYHKNGFSIVGEVPSHYAMKKTIK
ncbi:GNAT family N-acetyltransferase [Aneurinibacillus terranovensis]|uniref:GNAT family N-acetyltransferase n=1 Tax=Aneurinibacillus terranovensis TaxID=278991 RepID=UPI0003FB9835|nr:GNAT family N-acetyltransferase [Aneurinibacillus terranovensis]